MGEALGGREKELTSLTTLLFEISLFIYFSPPGALSSLLSLSSSMEEEEGEGEGEGREVGKRLLGVCQGIFGGCGEDKMFKAVSLVIFRLLLGICFSFIF